MRKLLERGLDKFIPIGVVRTTESKEGLVKEGIIPDAHITVADIINDVDSLEKAVMDHGVDAIIICTSATPAPTGEMSPEGGGPIFGFPNGQPEQVDWIGQKNQIDAAAKKASSPHVVICSSMGG